MVITPSHWAKSEPARQLLVATLRKRGIIQSERVAQAFLEVPREAFVPSFYEQEKGPRWIRQTPDMYEENRWIEKIYQDKPLVLLSSEKNQAISSSSAPTVMALMLEALQIEPGMRVLEIGTGSGYNAALSAFLVGNPNLVTTIELERNLAAQAERALHESIGDIMIQMGDGRLGVARYAPYDRIISTASSPSLPRSWFDQLAPHGRLVMDLQGTLNQSGFLIVQKSADGSTATGTFSEQYLHFMPLRTEEQDISPFSSLLQNDVTQEITLAMPALSEILFDETFHWFLQWQHPGMTLSRGTIKQGGPGDQRIITLIDAQRETILQLTEIQNGQWFARQRGGRGLWLRIERAYTEWRLLGKPARSDYSVEIDGEKAELLLSSSQKRYAL
jgi:protein-L-isoaspartate(D-aspartate) O-methyltransferase